MIANQSRAVELQLVGGSDVLGSIIVEADVRAEGSPIDQIRRAQGIAKILCAPTYFQCTELPLGWPCVREYNADRNKFVSV